MSLNYIVMNKFFLLAGLLVVSLFLTFGCTSPSMAISEPTVITVVDINGFTSNIKLDDLNDVDTTGVAVDDALVWDGSNWIAMDVNFGGGPGVVDTNWQTSWAVFDANMKGSFVPYVGANKDINFNYQNLYLINDANNRDNLRNMATSIDEMRNNTLLDKSMSTLSASGGVLTYRLVALNGMGEWDFNNKVYGGASAVPYADVNLICGTNNAPITNYVYFDLVVGVPTLKVSSTNLLTEHIDVAIFNVGACSGSSYNIFSYNRNRYEVDSFIQRVISRFEYSGTLYESGFVPTVNSSTLNATSGKFFNGIFEMYTSVDVNVANGFYFIKGDGNYVQSTNLNDLNVYTDGTSTGANYVNIVWGIVPSSTTGGGTAPTTPRLVAVLQSKPTAVYTNITNAVADAYEATNYYPPVTAVQQVFVPIARTIVRSGAFIDFGTGSYFKDLRGKVTSGGGASTPIDLSGYALKADVNTWIGQLDTNWQTSWSILDTNLLATYALLADVNKWIGQLDTNWQTSWTAFDANMKGTYRRYTVDLNTSERIQADKNFLIGSKGYIYDDGNSIIIGRTA